jgi:ATP-dependent DNA helicase RecQ
MEQLLKKYFGYDEFRPMQKEIVENVLQSKDSLVLMPTGGGKSLCYQIPALKLEGLTIVISPLISLMKDQVDSLKTNGVKAEYINSTLPFNEIENIKQKIREKETKLLYIAPERLALEEFKIFLASQQISLIAIDEAHCISEWGHDFRKDYRNLKFLKKFFPNVPIIALTATATLKVKEDILKQLSLKNPGIFVSSFNRNNLNLRVVHKKDTINKMVSLIRDHKDESVIIYCFSRKDTENITKQLNENGLQAIPYHAGLSSEVRKHNQDLFIKDKVNIIVATIAFGMGIDKPDVRLIIHHTFSKSVEGYYQEIGRAGRDGISSDCVLFYSRGDTRKHQFFLDKINGKEAKGNASAKLHTMISYCEHSSCRRKQILEYFGEPFLKSNCDGCDVCLKLPEIIGAVIEQKKSTGDKSLFEKLRALRRKIANARNVPPFIIFGDVSLREMSLNLPRDRQDFLRIHGVGKKKLDDFGEAFLEVINGHAGGETTVTHNRLAQIKDKSPNAYEPWKPMDDSRLEELYGNASVDMIAQILKRQPSAIRARLRKLGVG